MEIPKNTFKAAIKAGKRQLGMWSAIPHPSIAEMLAGCGFDWLLFDTEHAPSDPLVAYSLLQAASAYPVSTGVRPSALDVTLLKRVLDAGAQTVIVPYVQTPEEAALAVAAVTYPPEGIRGVAAGMRASRWGAVKDYAQKARDEIALIIQIETREALERLDEIAAVPGLDGIFVGPSDLAASLGYPGQPGHKAVRAACVDAITRIRDAGLPPGFLALDDVVLEEMVEAGSIFTAIDVDTALLRRTALSRIAEWRAKVS
ncbi:MAG: aldolase/citrate lyase family protein [Pseudomonadota bacterium]